MCRLNSSFCRDTLTAGVAIRSRKARWTVFFIESSEPQQIQEINLKEEGMTVYFTERGVQTLQTGIY